MTIQTLPAFYGDCLLVSWIHEGKKRNMLVDGGPPATYPTVIKKLVQQLETDKEAIDLLVVTHIDNDHIGGIEQWFKDVKQDKSLIKQVWFNSGGLISAQLGKEADDTEERAVRLTPGTHKKASFRQGDTLESLLNNANTQLIETPASPLIAGATLHILSPGREQLERLNKRWTTEKASRKMAGKSCDHDDPAEELLEKTFVHDDALPNGSSIVMLVEANCKKLLLLADAFPSVVEKAIRELNYHEDNLLHIDAVKVAHHGSKFNNSPGLYAIIRSQKFIISTDGTRDNFPHKEALARIVATNPGCTLYFNYPPPKNLFTTREQQKYKFSMVCFSGNNYTLEL